jgi:hypothetical protein
MQDFIPIQKFWGLWEFSCACRLDPSGQSWRKNYFKKWVIMPLIFISTITKNAYLRYIINNLAIWPDQYRGPLKGGIFGPSIKVMQQTQFFNCCIKRRTAWKEELKIETAEHIISCVSDQSKRTILTGWAVAKQGVLPR